ncbi:MAG: hypothetical protein M1818_001985 [Claussenomyces sp. TS43310]|nr:MAG: hypothetical protein M1818_001985 [Claussenomyces sp. TS43310]
MPAQAAQEAPASEDAVPSAIFAQAEAAILANADDSPRAHRLPSHDHVDSGQLRGTQNASGHSATSSAPARESIDPHQDTKEPPPPYGEHLDQLQLSQDGFDTKANLTDDGRVNININQQGRRLSDLLVPALRSQLSLATKESKHPLPPGYIPPALGGQPGQKPPPPMDIVIHVVGSRGDVQPFVALGKTLKSTYGHRVRLATHPTFRTFVEENGLEFFSIGGDPAELMAFMVKNPGLMPGMDSLKSGDVGKRRKGMEEILLGCWRSCIEAGDGTGAPTHTSTEEDSTSFSAGINMEASPTERPFIADAIIANPPSFAHVHIAEKLGIPLHLMFTMPWSPTQSFPHPLANIQSSNTDTNMTNFLSYALVEMMTWQGLGDLINRFREKALGLEAISLIWAPGVLTRLRIPYTYCWSPALIPKPKDWGQHISISGFYFLSLASSFTPDTTLSSFLANGPPPIYIGFGSIVVDDPRAMTNLIFEAVKRAGVRALVSKGWGGLGSDELAAPEGIFMLGNVPHDWLFKHVSCVVHHGGAGTTAAGIALGKPTVIVPFFGDQPFWGNMISRAGAGPPPIPFKQLTAEKLADAITSALEPLTLEKAQGLGEQIREEKGTEVGGKSFHDHLDVDNLRCSLAPSRVAVWRVKRTKIRLSALAATVLANASLMDFADLKLYRPREYETEDGPWDPISGGASALLGTITSLSMGVADFPVDIFKRVKGKASTVKSGSDNAHPRNSNASTGVSPTPSASQTEASSVGVRGSSSELSSERNSISTASSISANASNQKPDDLSLTDRPQSDEITIRPHRGSSLKQALSGTLTRSRSGSRNGRPRSRSCSPATRAREYDPSTVSLDSAISAGKGVSRIVGAGIKSPMDFTLGLARGFHNAPKLYGDDTVRPQEKVTDLQSGLKAAGREFGFGVYDGISGLVTQPMRGAEKEGATGLIKGIGKGLAGAFLKPGAACDVDVVLAIWGLPGYTFMGVSKEIRKLFGTSVVNYIVSARTAQGYEQWKSSTQVERSDIINRWQELQSELQRQKGNTQENRPEGPRGDGTTPQGIRHTWNLSFDERKKLYEERKTKGSGDTNKPQNQAHQREDTPSQPPIPSQVAPATQEEFEQAIRQSVASTSRGDAEEDMMIEQAIRASVRELQVTKEPTFAEQRALDRALEPGDRSRRPTRSDVESSTAVSEMAPRTAVPDEGGADRQVKDVDTDDDEDYKSAIAASKVAHANHLSAARTEEEVVLEYVKKQSLAELEHRKAVQGQLRPSNEAGEDDDADLKRAVEESMQTSAAREQA